MFIIQVEVVKGCGRFIPRKPWCNAVYDRILQRDKVNWHILHHCHVMCHVMLSQQVCQPQKVERDPYTGPVIKIPSQ